MPGMGSARRESPTLVEHLHCACPAWASAGPFLQGLIQSSEEPFPEVTVLMQLAQGLLGKGDKISTY